MNAQGTKQRVSKRTEFWAVLLAATLVALVVISGTLFSRALTHLETSLTQANEAHTYVLKLIDATENMALQSRLLVYSEQLAWENQYFEEAEELKTQLVALTPLLHSPQAMASYETFTESQTQIELINDQIFALMRQGQKKQARTLQESVKLEKLRFTRDSALSSIVSELEAQKAEALAKAESTKFSAQRATLAILFSIALVFTLFFNLTRSHNKALALQNTKLDALVETRTKELLDTAKKAADSQKMATLGIMASGIAHEINNPLAVINGKAVLLKHKAEAGAVPELPNLTESLEKIIAMSNRIAKIVKGLRSFARHGENDPKENVEVKGLVENSLELCRAKLKEFSVDYSQELPPGLAFIGREVQVSQVLVNLIKNACEAIHTEPKRWVRLDVKDMGPNLEFHVTDSGHGIPPDVVEKLMTPFFTTKEVGKGTGLGLSISRSIARDHGGDLYVDATCPNTRFILVIPKDGVGNSQSETAAAA